MGTNKALLPFLGKPLIARVIERLQPVAAEILVTTNQADDLAFLGLQLFADIVPGRGALGGLHTALQIATYSKVAVIACDMPFASSHLLVYQAKLLDETAVDAVVPQTEEGFEPFHAVYRKETCLPLIDAALTSGKRKLISWFPEAAIRFVNVQEMRKLNLDERVFFNVNTLEEFKIAETLASTQAL